MKQQKKYTLDKHENAVFKSIAIVSPDRDYKLCFRINKKLGIELSKNSYIYTFEKNSRKEILCHFSYIGELKSKIYIVKNKQDDFFIIPKVKNADYILIILDSAMQNSGEDLRKSLNEIPNIQTTFVLPQELTKNISLE